MGKRYSHKMVAFAIGMVMVLSITLSGCAGNSKKLNFEGATFSNFKVFDAPMKSLRGMAVSADGNAFYLGHIQLGTGGVRKLDRSTGEIKWTYNSANIPADNNYNEYPKGLATDDRGNVFAVVSHNKQSFITLAALNGEDGAVLSETKIELGQIDAGANGIAIYKDGDQYYAYFITNYGPNRIYCYNVTDPAKPEINKDFGADGFVSLANKTGVEGADGNYIAMDDSGTMYITMKLGDGSKGDCVVKADKEGKTFEKIIDCEEAYGISLADGYLIVSTYNGEGSVVNLYNVSDYKLAATLGGDVEKHGHYSQAFLVDNKLYIVDQGYQTGASANEIGSRIIVSNDLAQGQ